MPSLKHTHSYIKLKGRKGYYMCSHPDCSHTAEKNLIRGKASMCECGQKFILNAANLQLAVPKCLMCRNSKEARAFKAGVETFNNLFPSISDGAAARPEDLNK